MKRGKCRVWLLQSRQITRSPYFSTRSRTLVALVNSVPSMAPGGRPPEASRYVPTGGVDPP